MYRLGVVLDVQGTKGLSTLKAADKELKSVDQSGKKAEGTLGKVSSALNRVSNALRGNAGGAGSGGFLPGLANVSNIIQGIPQIGNLAHALISPLTGAAQAGIQFNAFLETTEIALKRHFGGSRDLTHRFVNEVRQFAQASPFRTEGLIKTIIYGTATGFSPRDALALVKDVGDAIASTGDISAETVEGVVRALSQMKAKGRVSAEEMEQLAERGIPAWEMLAHSIGKTVAETRKLSEQGKLHGPSAVAALRAEMRARYGGMMDELQGTLTGRLSALADAVQAGEAKATEQLTRDISTSVGAGLQRAGLIDSLASVINGAITPVSGLIRTAAEGVLGGGLTSGIVQGVGAGKALVVSAVKDLALDGILGTAMEWLGINSPSWEMHKIGVGSAKGFRNGFVEEMTGSTIPAIESMFDLTLQKSRRAARVNIQEQNEQRMRALFAREPDFLPTLKRESAERGINPDDILNLIAIESSFNKTALNRFGYLGLGQIGRNERRSIGLPFGDREAQSLFASRSATWQLENVLFRFLDVKSREAGFPLRSLDQIYSAWGSGSANRNPNFVHASRGGKRAGMYANNPLWDHNRDGMIQQWEFGPAALTKLGAGLRFTINDAPVTTANPIPVSVVSGASGGSFNSSSASALFGLGRSLQDTGTTVVEVNDALGQIVTTATQVVGVEGLHFYRTQQLTQATERQTLAAGHAAETVLGLAKSAESTGQRLLGMLAGISGLMPQQQVGRKRGFLSKLLGVAAPFLSFIPGVGGILSTLAGIGSSAVAGDWGGVLTGAVAGFAPGGAFRGSGGSGGALAPQPVNFTNPATRLPGRARGGPVQRGRAYVVGEERAEVVEFGDDGYVHPSVDSYFANRRGRGAAGGGWGAMIERLMQQLERSNEIGERQATALNRFEAMPADHVVMTASRTVNGQRAIGDAYMSHADRDPRVVEWMNRRTNTQ